MIKRILNIVGVGRFYGWKDPKDGSCDFQVNTLFFGMNGYGKSTLTAILRAFKSKTADRIIERKTMGDAHKSLRQSVVIELEDGSIHNFKNGSWTSSSGAKDEIIEIFDEEYVRENLFVDEIKNEHKQQIYNIIVGKEGVKLSEELEEARKDRTVAVKNFNKLNDELKEHNRKADVPDYLQLTEDDIADCERQITEIDALLKAAEEPEKIKQKPLISELLSPRMLDIDNIEVALSEKLEDFDASYRQRILDHVSSHMKDGKTITQATDFLRFGLSAIDEENYTCPFCGQSLDPVEDLMAAFRGIFNDTYETLRKKVIGARDEAARFDANTIIDKLILEIQKIDAQISSWSSIIKEELSGSLTEDVDQEALKTQLSKAFEALKNELNRKVEDLNRTAEPGAVEKYKDAKSVIQQIVTDINEQIKTLNERVTSFKERAESPASIEDAKKKTRGFEHRLFRFTEEGMVWVTGYNSAKEEKEKADDKFKEIEDKLNKYLGNFSNYEDEINRVLKELNTSFSVRSFKEKTDKRMGKLAEFEIVINGEGAPLSSSENVPCFKNILSGGDRNSLAFAFFIASLKYDPKLSDTIVIYDDPLTSMDDDRRYQTAKIIATLSSDCLQTIVLTHRKSVAIQHQKYYRDKKKYGVSGEFEIRCDDTGSRYERCDPSEFAKDSFAQKVEELDDYCRNDSGQSISYIQHLMRDVLEGVLNRQYYRYISKIDKLSAKIAELKHRSLISDKKTEMLNEIRVIANAESHQIDDFIPERELTRTELVGFINKMFSALEGQ